jgi:hypothetical protein
MLLLGGHALVQFGTQFLACHGSSAPFSDNNSQGDFENLPGYVSMVSSLFHLLN